MKLILVEPKVADKDSWGGHLSSHQVGLYRDSETGVEYFIMNAGNAGAMCPRLDAYGKPVIYRGE